MPYTDSQFSFINTSLVFWFKKEEEEARNTKRCYMKDLRALRQQCVHVHNIESYSKDNRSDVGQVIQLSRSSKQIE